MPNTSRRNFLTISATAGVGTLALASCSGDEPSPAPSPSASSPTGETGRASGSYADAVKADKPLLYLPLQDELGATEMAEESGHGRTVKPVGERWWANDALTLAAPDAVGRSWYSGDGAEACHVDLPDPGWLGEALPQGLTVELWWLADQMSWKQAFLHLASAKDDNGWRFGTRQDGTALGFDGFEMSGVELACPKLDDRTWHHVVCSIAGDGTVSGFVDGKPAEGSGKVKPFTGEVQAARLFGLAKGEGGVLGGNVSQLAIYPGVLSDERVKAHHEAGLAEADPVVRGADPWFGGVAEYYKQFDNAEVFADDKRFPIGEWWMNCTDEEFAIEKQYADGAIVIDPKNTPEGARKAGLWVIRAVDQEINKGKPGAETVGWLPSDEPDMSDEKEASLAKDIEKAPKEMLRYINYGTGVILSTIDRYRVKKMVPDSIHQFSADMYAYCNHPRMDEMFAKYWNIDAKYVRRAVNHGRVVERMRAFLPDSRPVWGAIATGHANHMWKDYDGWGSVPSADEFEGSAMACIIGGASGLLVFPQCFPDEKRAPDWSADKQYEQGDTVVEPGTEQFWYARVKPAKGVHPKEVTDDSWLGWRPNAFGIRNKENYARGVSDRVKHVRERLHRLAPVFHSRSVPKRFNEKLYTRYWPSAPDGHAYVLAMQNLGNDEGSYELKLPAGVSVDQVEVVDEGRTIKVSDGVFTDEFAAEWVHHLYRWKA